MKFSSINTGYISTTVHNAVKMVLLKVSVLVLVLLHVLSAFSASLGGEQTVGNARSRVIVSTLNGLVQGEQFTGKSLKTWFRFRGIPFAEPPVGQLRFEVRYMSMHAQFRFRIYKLWCSKI